MSDTGLTARKIEQILRAAGISKRAARAIIAHGWQGQDDADAAEAEAILKTIDAATERLKGLCK